MLKNRKTQKTAIMLLSCLLVVTIALGGTLAYLTSQTNREVNNFSFPKDSEGLSAMLTEPDWDGAIAYESVTDSSGNISMIPIYDYTEDGNPIYGYIDGNVDNPVTDKTAIDSTVKRPDTNINCTKDINKSGAYGVDVAKQMIPGATAYKNPMITNTSTVTDEWVAVKVTFVYTKTHTENGIEYKSGAPLIEDDMRNLLSVVSIGYTSINWEQINSVDVDGEVNPTLSQQGAVYYYKEKLNKNGGQTAPLFTNVCIDKDKENATYDMLGHLKETGFTIYIEGFAVQSALADSYGEFKDWGMDGNVVFNNTPTDGNPVDVSKICLPA